MEDTRLNHLLTLYFEGELTPAEKLELETVLLASAQARSSFWEYATLHAMTHEAAKVKWSLDSKAQAVADMPAPTTPANAFENLVTWWSGRRRAWIWRMTIGGAFAVLMLGLFQAWYPHRNVATLAQAIDVEWAATTPALEAGALLSPGWLQLNRGTVEIRFNQGVSVIFEAPAELNVVSSDEAFCRLGRFRVYVPAQARGFKLGISDLEIIDLGTEFGLSLPPGNLAEVHVFSGKVELIRTANDTETIRINEGHAVRIAPDMFHPISASFQGFLNETNLAQRGLATVRDRQQRWRLASQERASNPETVLNFNFDGQTSWDKILLNRLSQPPPESHGIIMGCDWTEGRWPGKKALQFKNPQDRVRFQLAQPLEAVTCLVWVRVDGLPNTFTHSLLTGDSEGPGTLRWTLSHQGQMRFGIAKKGSGSEAAWGLGMSPSVVKKEHLGQWLMLATAYDGKTVFHYLNGELVWSGSVVGPGALKFGWVELGNWVATRDNPDFQWAKSRSDSFFNRNFVGCFDEVLVFSKVIVGEEIQKLYEAGRPLDLVAIADKD